MYTWFVLSILLGCGINLIFGAPLDSKQADGSLDSIAKSQTPWHAVVFRSLRTGKKPEYACGGTIISQNMILTAAHCVFGGSSKIKVDISEVFVAVGTGFTKWNDANATNAQFYNVVETIVHPNYAGMAQYFRDDIAAIKIAGKIKFNDYVSPACIDQEPSEPVKGTISTATGYKDGDEKNLRDINLPIFTLEECIKKSTEDFVPYLKQSNLCGLDLEEDDFVGLKGFGGSGVFLTSSKGPMKCIRGIISLGTNFQRMVTLTDVQKYMDWIKHIKGSTVETNKLPVSIIEIAEPQGTIIKIVKPQLNDVETAKSQFQIFLNNNGSLSQIFPKLIKISHYEIYF